MKVTPQGKFNKFNKIPFPKANVPVTRSVMAKTRILLISGSMDLCESESNWPLQRITVNTRLKKKYSLIEYWALWRQATMQHISTLKPSVWCLHCPSDWNETTYSLLQYVVFIRNTLYSSVTLLKEQQTLVLVILMAYFELDRNRTVIWVYISATYH